MNNFYAFLSLNTKVKMCRSVGYKQITQWLHDFSVAITSKNYFNLYLKNIWKFEFEQFAGAHS